MLYKLKQNGIEIINGKKKQPNNTVNIFSYIKIFLNLIFLKKIADNPKIN